MADMAMEDLGLFHVKVAMLQVFNKVPDGVEGSDRGGVRLTRVSALHDPCT